MNKLRTEQTDYSLTYIDQGQDASAAVLMVNTAIVGDPGKPRIFREAMYGKDKEIWHQSMANKILNLTNFQAWDKVDR